jgi:hypothetical protein
MLKTLIGVCLLLAVPTSSYCQDTPSIDIVISEGHSFNITMIHVDVKRNFLFTVDRTDKFIVWDLRHKAKINSLDLSQYMIKYGSVKNVEFHSYLNTCLITLDNKILEFDIENGTIKTLAETKNHFESSHYFQNHLLIVQKDELLILAPDADKVTKRYSKNILQVFNTEHGLFYLEQDSSSSYSIRQLDNEKYKLQFTVPEGRELEQIRFDQRTKVVAYTTISNDDSSSNFTYAMHMVDGSTGTQKMMPINMESIYNGFAISKSGKYLVYPDAKEENYVDSDILRVFDLSTFEELPSIEPENPNLFSSIWALDFVRGDREIMCVTENLIYTFDILTEHVIQELPKLSTRINDTEIVENNVFVTFRAYPDGQLSKFSLNDFGVENHYYNDVHFSGLNYLYHDSLLAVYFGDFIEFYNADNFQRHDSVSFYAEEQRNNLWRLLHTYKSSELDSNILVCKNVSTDELLFDYVNLDKMVALPGYNRMQFDLLHPIGDLNFLGISNTNLALYDTENDFPLAYTEFKNSSDTLFKSNGSNQTVVWLGQDELFKINVFYDTIFQDDLFEEDLFEDALEGSQDDSNYNTIEHLLISKYKMSKKYEKKMVKQFPNFPVFLNVSESKGNLKLSHLDFQEKSVEISKAKSVRSDTVYSEADPFFTELPIGDNLYLKMESYMVEGESGYTDIRLLDEKSLNYYNEMANSYDPPDPPQGNTVDESVGYIQSEYASIMSLNDTLYFVTKSIDEIQYFELFDYDKESRQLNSIGEFGPDYFWDISDVLFLDNKIFVSGESGTRTNRVPSSKVYYLDNASAQHKKNNQGPLEIIEQPDTNNKWKIENAEDINNRFFFDIIHQSDSTRRFRIYYFNGRDWLIQNEDKYYFGTEGAFDHINFKNGIEIYSFEQFDMKYNRPDIILKGLGYADNAMIKAYHAAYLKRLKKMRFTEDMLENDFHLPELKIGNFETLPAIQDGSSIDLDINMIDGKYPLDRINVWVNDVAIYGTGGISVRDKNVLNYSTTLKVNLAKGNNTIKMSVLNQAGTESYKETIDITCTAGKELPDLYLITIGESKFQQSDFNLTYASKDAKDISDLFSESKAFQNVFSKSLINEQVTRGNVMALREFLMEAGINDEVMIFIAGHGVLDSKLDYYFATYDMDFQNPATKGLAYEDLEGLLDGINPIKKTLLIDACHSGEIDKEEVVLTQNVAKEKGKVQFRAVGNIVKPKLGVKNISELTKTLFTDLRKGTGATVISSAGGMEFAIEGEDWKNGLFTYCLINGIRTKKADYNGDNQIWLSEIQRYVAENVSILSGGKQSPTSRIENHSVDFRVW